MGEYSPANAEALRKQQVRSAHVTFFENKVPSWDALGQYTPKAGDITFKGVSIPLKTTRPGGFVWYTPDDSDFGEYFAPNSNRMYAFPVGAALGLLMQGAARRSFTRDAANSLQSEDEWYADHVEAFLKQFNYMVHGDGSGRLAVSASTLGSTGSSQTLNCATTAATTPGQTKGAVRLELGHKYAAWNPSTAALRGTFQVEATGGSSCTVNVLSGTISSGDDITHIRSYNRAFRGLPHFIDNATRVVQTRNTGKDRDLNDPIIDLNGATLTPVTFSALETMLGVRNNDVTAEGGIRAMAFMTPGNYHLLRVQQYGYRMNVNEGQSTARGVARRFVVDGIDFVLDADGEDDRGYIVKKDKEPCLAWYTEKEFGPYEQADGDEWRMLFGTNSTGSDRYQKAIGWVGALVKVQTRCAAGFKRSALPAETQVSLA